MSNNSITITRALVELKTLDKRIEKAQRDAVFVTYKCEDETNPKHKVTENLYQKAKDLIEYRKKLKGAVVQSNSTTKVRIGNHEYTVAEAIERKTSINYEKRLLNKMKTQLGDTTKLVERHNQRARETVDQMISQALKNGQKVDATKLQEMNDTFLNGRRAELVDPMNLSDKIQTLEDQIVGFESEVDLILTESNATTFITVG